MTPGMPNDLGPAAPWQGRLRSSWLDRGRLDPRLGWLDHGRLHHGLGRLRHHLAGCAYRLAGFVIPSASSRNWRSLAGEAIWTHVRVQKLSIMSHPACHGILLIHRDTRDKSVMIVQFSEVVHATRCFASLRVVPPTALSLSRVTEGRDTGGCPGPSVSGRSEAAVAGGSGSESVGTRGVYV
jgi:hypothetical protein